MPTEPHKSSLGLSGKPRCVHAFCYVGAKKLFVGFSLHDIKNFPINFFFFFLLPFLPFPCPLFRILSPQSSLMKHLGQIMPMEIAAGMNGRVWIRCKTIAATIAAMNAITNAEFMTEAEIRLMVHKLHDTIH